MPPRNVPFSTLLRLLRQRGPLALLGLIFTGVGLVVLAGLVGITASLRQPHEGYDYAAIWAQGRPAPATVTALETQLNTTVNGRHPTLITYQYVAGGQPRTDQFQALDTAGAALRVGRPVEVRVLGGQSMVSTLEPFSFPWQFFLVLPGIFLTLGVVFLLLSLPEVLRTYRLYQRGEVREAVLRGITLKTTYSRPAQQYYLVSYEYAGPGGAPVLGESPTSDLLLVQEKKYGDRIPILVSPTDPTRSCLLPRLEALRNGWAV